MRKYKIKKGYNPDVGMLISEYFGANGDINKGLIFEVEGIGKIDMRQDKKTLFVNIEPPNKICGDYNLIKKWNDFLYNATGKTTKERKKEFGR